MEKYEYNVRLRNMYKLTQTPQKTTALGATT